MSKVTKIVVGFLVVLFVVGCSDERRRSVDAAKQWELKEFFVFAGWPHEIDCPDDEAIVKAVADLDYNVIMWDSSKLELCKKYGLKLMIDHGQKGWDPPGDSRWAVRWREYMERVGPLTPEMAASHIGDDNVWGYHIYDEPPVEKFDDMRAQQVVLNEADPSHPAYINLFSGGGDYLDQYMETVKPNFVSFDYYQWWWGNEGHYSNLEQYRAAALKADVPLFSWVEINANKDSERGEGDPPDDNLIKLRQSVYTNLAYGVKGIQWFTTPNVFEHGTANVTPEGKDVGVINKELKKIGPVLVKLRSTEVYHSLPVQEHTKQLPDDHWVETEAQGLVLGFFKDDDHAKSDYLLVANKNFEKERWVTLNFDRPVKKVRKFDKIKGKWKTLKLQRHTIRKSIKFILEPGDGDLFRIY